MVGGATILEITILHGIGSFALPLLRDSLAITS
jgi:hypothetical protein